MPAAFSLFPFGAILPWRGELDRSEQRVTRTELGGKARSARRKAQSVRIGLLTTGLQDYQKAKGTVQGEDDS